jgi:hypothetical protein
MAFRSIPTTKELTMKIKVLVAMMALVSSGAVFAADASSAAPQVASPMAGQPEKPIPRTPEAWLERMTDFTQNMSSFKDPRVFVPWSQAVTEPSFYVAMGNGMMDPGGWLRMMNSMYSPQAYTNFMKFADPNVWFKWMGAGMDPNFYTAMLTQFSDPGKMMRWAMAPMDPKLMGMMMQPLNPNLYMRWGMAPMDPRAWNLAMQPLNPNLYMSWMGTMMNPQTYGPTWAGFMNPAGFVPVPGTVGGMAPAGSPTAFNPFDPSMFTQFMNPAAWTGGAVQAPAAAAPTAGSAAPTFNWFDPQSWANMFTVPAQQPAAKPGPATK